LSLSIDNAVPFANDNASWSTLLLSFLCAGPLNLKLIYAWAELVCVCPIRARDVDAGVDAGHGTLMLMLGDPHSDGAATTLKR